MLRSRLLIRQSIPPIVVTRTRRGAAVELVRHGIPSRYVGALVVLAVMVGGAASTAWQIANSADRPLTADEILEMQDKAFRAGREVAYEEMSHGVGLAYEQGREDALKAENQARRGAR